MTEIDRQQFGAMQEHIKSLDDTTKRIEDKLDKFIDASESRYAPMWSARLWLWFGSAAGGFIVLYVLKIIFTHQLALQ